MIKNVLLLEDDEDIAFIVKFYLEKEGINVIVVNDIHSAKNFLDVKEHLPDIILFDLFIGEEYGGDFVNYLSERNKFDNIPLILVTGSRNQEKIEEILGMKNVAGFIEKPFSSNYFYKQIKKFYDEFKGN